MEGVLQVIISGILIGGLYGLFSSGLSLIFGITRVVNFAHGDFVTMGMYGAFLAFSVLHLGPLESVIPVAIIMFVLGYLIFWLIIRHTVERKSNRPNQNHDAQLVITLALGIFIQNALLVAFSPGSQSISSGFEGAIKIGPFFLNTTQFVAFVVSVIFFGLLYLVLTTTSFGKAVQATVDDKDMAQLVGINPSRIYALNFAIGVALAAVAGVVLLLYYPATPTAGTSLLVIAFVVVVLGGLGNVLGAFLGGMVVGVIQIATATYVSLSMQNIGVFIVFIILLLFRPQGLLGRGRV